MTVVVDINSDNAGNQREYSFVCSSTVVVFDKEFECVKMRAKKVREREREREQDI
jgi:hypothetical protein